MFMSMFRDTINKLNSISNWLTTYWTAERAAKVDYLDAAISSRAPASSAVSNAYYTAGRAALLDGIIQNSVIASIQTGVITYSHPALGSGIDTLYSDITITAVNAAKSIVLINGSAALTTGAVAFGRLLNNTTVRVSSTQTTLAACWTVVEFK